MISLSTYIDKNIKDINNDPLNTLDNLDISKKVVLTNKYMLNQERNQVCSETNSIIDEDILNNLEYVCRNLSAATKQVFNSIVGLDNNFDCIWATQTYISDRSGISRVYCNKVIKSLEKLGFISTYYRHMTSKLYTVSSFFSNPFVRSRLSQIFKSFRYFAFITLLSNINKSNVNNTKSCLYEYVTQLNIKVDRNINISNHGYCKSTDGEILSAGMDSHGSQHGYNRALMEIDRYKSGNNNTLSDISDKRILKPGSLGNKLLKRGNDISSEDIMMQSSRKIYGENPISPVIRKLKELNLSKWGQIKLSAFPDEVLKDSYEKLKYHKNIRNKYNWFFKLCLNYCHREGIKPDFNWSNMLAKSYKMPIDAPMILPLHFDTSYLIAPLKSHVSKAHNYDYKKCPKQRDFSEKNSGKIIKHYDITDLHLSHLEYVDNLVSERFASLSGEECKLIEENAIASLPTNNFLLTIEGIVQKLKQAFYIKQLITVEENDFIKWAAQQGYYLEIIDKSTYRLLNSSPTF